MTMSSLVIAIFLLSIGASFVQRTTGFYTFIVGHFFLALK